MNRKLEQLKEVDLFSDGGTSSKKVEPSPTYDEILHEIGDFGVYQILVAVYVGFALACGSFVTMNFVFAADITEHRCWIPECEPIHSSDFNAPWLKRAIPYKDGRPDACSRYESIGSANGTCSERNFNRSRVVTCDEYVTKDNERRLLFHLNMTCSGQNNKLALIATASTLGRTIGMPIFGLFSDKFGRLTTITTSATLGAVFSTLQALPSHLMSFELYWTLEFLASLLSTGLIAAGFVYNMEWTTAKYRVRLVNISVFIEAIIPFISISLLAWYFADNFIAYRLILALPVFLLLGFHFILGESPQWLLAQSKHDRVIESFSTAARINRKPLHLQTIERIARLSKVSFRGSAADKPEKVSMTALLRQKTLAFRLVITSLTAMFIGFAFFGMFLSSTKAHSNKYLSFLLLGLADLPGTIISELLLNRIGRRLTIGLALPVYSGLLVASTQLQTDQKTVQLILFVIGKAAIVAAIVGYHTFSTEFWPTSVRNTASSIGTMAGRLGTILASLAVLLGDYHVDLPVVLNAAAGIFGAILVFAFLPETMHCVKLPDTMEEALDIGRSVERKSKDFTAENSLHQIKIV